MEKRRFRVETTCRQRTIHVIEAQDSEEAKRLAAERWQRGDPSDIAGFDWRELVSIDVMPAPDAERERQDDEVILRFIRERERLLTRLGDHFAGPSAYDAISAPQAAQDLGWYRPDGLGVPVPDAVRAAEALERLTAERSLVSFQRTRSRSRERGEIVLYCTPEYLDQLSATLDDGLGASAAVG